MLKITIVVGNPKPNSKTADIAKALVGKIFDTNSNPVRFIDLATHADEIFKSQSQTMADLSAHVAASNFVLFACPTYKATYTGLLKGFLDRYPANGLKNVTALAMMTGADFSHSLAPTVQLVPLLLELGARVPMSGLYFNTGQMDQINDLISARAEEAIDMFRSLAPVVGAIRTSSQK